MREYLVILTPTSEEFKTNPSEAQILAISGHFQHFSAALAEGKLLLAGRTEAKEHGIGILRFGSFEDADAFMQADPAIAGGVMNYRLFPFSIALGDVFPKSGEK